MKKTNSKENVGADDPVCPRNKGITLIALVITIVVLLILAIVSINLVINEGIIKHAENATGDYKNAEEYEQSALDGYLSKMEENNPFKVKWTQNGTTVTNGTVTLEVGTTITGYDETRGGTITGLTDVEWQVLGAENGELLIVSATNVVESYELDAYADGVAKLNTACEPYGKGTYATGARSIKAEDINRVIGYNPDTAGYKKGTLQEHGVEVTYTKNSDGTISYSSTNGLTGIADVDGWSMYHTSLGGDSNGIKIRNNNYIYYPTTLTDSNEGEIIGISESSFAYQCLFGKIYWLANVYVECYENHSANIEGGYKYVSNNKVNNYFIWGASGFPDSKSVRAVVSLQADVPIDSTGKIS